MTDQELKVLLNEIDTRIERKINSIIINQKDKFQKLLDKSIEQKVKAETLNHLGFKWHSLVSFLTALALFLAGFTYIGNLKMESVKDKMESVEDKMESIERMLRESKKVTTYKALQKTGKV